MRRSRTDSIRSPSRRKSSKLAGCGPARKMVWHISGGAGGSESVLDRSVTKRHWLHSQCRQVPRVQSNVWVDYGLFAASMASHVRSSAIADRWSFYAHSPPVPISQATPPAACPPHRHHPANHPRPQRNPPEGANPMFTPARITVGPERTLLENMLDRKRAPLIETVGSSRMNRPAVASSHRQQRRLG